MKNLAQGIGELFIGCYPAVGETHHSISNGAFRAAPSMHYSIVLIGRIEIRRVI